ncbi:MAG TPA: SMC-Scp complex subunit ScpB [Candidatus Paceibacterota bacterium]
MNSLNDKATLLTAYLYTQARVIGREVCEKLFNLEGDEFNQIGNIVKTRLEGTGLAVLISKKDIALVTDPSLGKDLTRLIDEESAGVLTPVQAETLSLIAYGDRITRSQLDYLRGVSSRFIVRVLLMRGLIEEEKNADQTYLVPTGEFLRSVGVAEAQELPDYEAIQQEIWNALEGMNQ